MLRDFPTMSDTPSPIIAVGSRLVGAVEAVGGVGAVAHEQAVDALAVAALPVVDAATAHGWLCCFC